MDKKTVQNKVWRTARREISYSQKTLIMAILNVTPDSFSDGGEFYSTETALRQAEKLIEEGADILDIGGESTRPNGTRVSVEEEIRRVVPVIEAVAKHFEIPISVDTSKSSVARLSMDAGAEIVNDISGLRFDEDMAETAFRSSAGLVLMHLRGDFADMHRQEPVSDIFAEVSAGLDWSIRKALDAGIGTDRLCLDVGIGFGKSVDQNIELIARLDVLCQEFAGYPMLVGNSRKSFIGNILGEADASQRKFGTLAANAICVWNGADILRVHDVRATIDAVRVVEELRKKS